MGEINFYMEQEGNFCNVEFCANKMKKDPKRYFKAQGKFKDNQIKSKNDFFINLFKEKNFKTEARKYLFERGLI